MADTDDSERPIPVVHNLVATAQIQTSAPLQLDRLNQIFRFSSFNRRKFAAVTLRLTRPNCTILLFTSGKLVITGSKSSSEALLSAYHVCRLLRRVCVGQKFQVVAYDIQNIVRYYSIIYEFISVNDVHLQVGNAELDVKEGQILDIEGAPESRPL
jgi:transcription initiation factor TFIID TATA-box-binding protein